MSLGERCDAIVRLIDEALSEVHGSDAAAPGSALERSAGISSVMAYLCARTTLAEARAAAGFDDRDEAGEPDPRPGGRWTPAPGQAAAGF